MAGATARAGLRTVERSLVGLLVLFSGSCYRYTPLAGAPPGPDVELSLALSDQGRVEARATLGAGLDRVEGRVAQVNDTAYVLHVVRVQDIRGAVTQWSGETVTVPRAWVGNAYARQLSHSRTYLVATAFTAALTAFIATRTLAGNGGPTSENPGGGGGNQQ